MSQCFDDIVNLIVICQLAEFFLQPAIDDTCIHPVDKRIEAIGRFLVCFSVFLIFLVIIVFILGSSCRCKHEAHHQ